MDEKTEVFKSNELQNENIKNSLKSIYEDLLERGYNPIKQLTGYLISGDTGYISSYKECRNRLLELDRNSIIELILESYIK